MAQTIQYSCTTCIFGSIRVADGAAATPSITFAGDTTTGFLHISSGYIGLAGYFLPAYNATYDLGSSSYNWNNLFLAANATVGGEVYVSNGSSSTPSYSFTNASTIGLFDSGGSVAEVGNFIAGTDATYNLGASSTSGRFANAYFSGTFGNRDQHDVHDADTPYDQRDGGHRAEQQRHRL